MPPEFVARLRAQLLRLTDPKILNAFKEDVTGFQEASPHDFDELEEDMEKARQFETR